MQSAFTPYSPTSHFNNFPGPNLPNTPYNYMNPTPTLSNNPPNYMIPRPKLPTTHLAQTHQSTFNQKNVAHKSFTTASSPNPIPPQSNPKSKHAQIKPNTQTSSSITMDITMSLFGNSMHNQHQLLPTSISDNIVHHLASFEASEFPPLTTESVLRIDNIGGKDEGGDAQPIVTDEEEMRHRNRVAKAKGKQTKNSGVNAATASWADIVEEDQGAARKVGGRNGCRESTKGIFR